MTTPPLDSVGTLVSRQLDKLSGRKRKVFTRREIKETFGLVNSKMFSQLIWKRKKIELSVERRFSDQKCWIKFSTSLCSNRFRANSIGALAIQGNFRLLLQTVFRDSNCQNGSSSAKSCITTFIRAINKV